jgi:hypothetical protein
MNNSGGRQNGQNGVGGTADVVLSSMNKIEDLIVNVRIYLRYDYHNQCLIYNLLFSLSNGTINADSKLSL